MAAAEEIWSFAELAEKRIKEELRAKLVQEVALLVTKFGLEGESDTPNHVIAKHMVASAEILSESINGRAEFWARSRGQDIPAE